MPACSVRKDSVSHKAEQQISDRHYCWLRARNPSLCVRFRFSFEDGGNEGERGWHRVDGESSGTWGPRRLTCATWLASRSRVMESGCFEADKIGGETPYSRRALTSRFLQGQAPSAVISALCSQEQSLRGFIVLELEKPGPVRSVMVARMRCEASGGREARSAVGPVGLVEAAYPLPPFFPLSPVSNGWSLGSALYTWLRAAYRRGWSAEWSRGS